jgi:hypothetical protein
MTDKPLNNNKISQHWILSKEKCPYHQSEGKVLVILTEKERNILESALYKCLASTDFYTIGTTTIVCLNFWEVAYVLFASLLHEWIRL